MWVFNKGSLEMVRKVKGINQREAADLLGIRNRQQWNDWERGKITPSVNSLVDIANRMGVNPMFFFANTNDLNQQEANHD